LEKKVPKLKLFVDLDGVLYNWDQAANEILTELTGKPLTYPSYSWDSLEQEAGPEAWHQMWNDWSLMERMFGAGQPILGAVAAMRKLIERYHITIITSRPRRSRRATIKWLSDNDIPFDSLVIIGPGIPKPIAHPIRPDIFIDDKPKNIEEAQKLWGLSNFEVILFGTAYNHGAHPSRIDNWDDILRRML
jgi:5'(3')-deoxyribonucleotidase